MLGRNQDPVLYISTEYLYQSTDINPEEIISQLDPNIPLYNYALLKKFVLGGEPVNTTAVF